MSAQVQPRLTLQEYLDLEERSLEIRHEFYHGRIYEMADNTFRHSVINGNLLAELNLMLRNKRQSHVASSSLRVRVTEDGLYTYPDIVVVCGEPELITGAGETLLNPTLVAEVLSTSTEAYDRGFKAAQYRKLASLKEYVIVSQHEPRVEVVRRNEDGEWQILDFAGMESVCHLASVDCNVALADIYGGVVFDAPNAEPQHPSANN